MMPNTTAMAMKGHRYSPNMRASRLAISPSIIICSTWATRSTDVKGEKKKRESSLKPIPVVVLASVMLNY